MKKLLKFLITAAILAGLSFVIYSKFIKKEDKIEYLTIKPTLGTLTNSVVATGEISAQNLVDVGAQVGGQIKNLYVEVGDRVKKGDLIAQIDSVKQENEIDKLKAQHEIYLADLNATKIAYEIANTKFSREKNLWAKKATSKEAYEDARNSSALKVAELAQIEAKIKQNQIDLDTAMTNLSYTKIVSPLDGTIVSTIVKEGQTVNANQTTPIIVQIADLTSLEINMEIAEGDLPRIGEGMLVRYTILADSKRVMEGSIDKIDPAMTTLSDGSLAKSSSGTGTNNSAVYYYAKVLVDNKDEFLKIGMTTENEIVIEESIDTLYISKSAIKSENDRFFVQILNGEIASLKEVTLGITDGFYQEIISGLDRDDDVIINDSTSILKNQSGSMRGIRM